MSPPPRGQTIDVGVMVWGAVADVSCERRFPADFRPRGPEPTLGLRLPAIEWVRGPVTPGLRVRRAGQDHVWAALSKPPSSWCLPTDRQRDGRDAQDRFGARSGVAGVLRVRAVGVGGWAGRGVAVPDWLDPEVGRVQSERATPCHCELWRRYCVNVHGQPDDRRTRGGFGLTIFDRGGVRAVRCYV